MTIAVLEPVMRKEWGGSPLPWQPLGMWSFSGTLAGDASGGSKTLEMAFNLQGVSAILDSNLYSLDQLFFLEDASASQNAQVLSLNMGEITQGVNLTVALQDIGATGESAVLGRDALGFRGIFLGQQIDGEQSSTLGVRVINVLNEVLTVEAYGYFWGARSRSYLGGPQRYPSGLFPG